MIVGKDIENLVNLLVSRRVILFHACQLVDFQSYLNLRGIPSRACLDESGLPFTKFETDGDDHGKGVWDKVFMNFSDFGRTFANGGNAVPNPYGPILLEIDPTVLYEAEDIAVCIQPVGGSEFTSREHNSLKTISDIDRIFVHSDNTDYPKSTWVKFKGALREEFGCYKPCDPDISCSVTNGRLPLKYIKKIYIDPYIISSKLLRVWVAEMCHPKAASIIHTRISKRRTLYNELADLIVERIPSCYDLSQSQYTSGELKMWIQEIAKKDQLQDQFRRYAKYLQSGTLLYLSK